MAHKETSVVVKTRVLVIDDNQADFDWVQERLIEVDASFHLDWQPDLKKGLDHLTKNLIDVVLLDLFLPDSKGLATFNQVKTYFRDMPIVIFSGLDDEKAALDAVQSGAEDYLNKGQVDGKRLARVLKYAIRRQDVRREVLAAGLKDQLTGLYNREGFFLMSDQHAKISSRNKNGFTVCFLVLNNISSIIESHGELEGNYALMTVADILKDSFRDSDVIARLGPDGFAVLLQEESFSKVVATRIRKNEKFHQAQFNQYKLSLSLCVILFDPSQPQAIKDLAAQADKLLSLHKNKQTTEELSIAES